MPVTYGGNSIIPAPFVSITQENQTTDDGQIIGHVYVITVTGKLSAYKGSPNSSGTFWTSSGYPPDEVISGDSRLAAILAKQYALRNLFATEGQTFEITPWDGSAPTKFNPRVRKPPEFRDGLWFEETDYTIVLEADVVYLQGTPIETTLFDGTYVSKAAEDWNLEVIDEYKKTYRLSHSVTATGKRFYDSSGDLVAEAWENAQTYVLQVIGLGLDATQMNPTALGTSLQAFNYLRTTHCNELGGTYSVTETWLCYDPGSNPPAYEDWTVNIRTTANEAGRVNVTVDGTVTGLEQRNNETFSTIIVPRYTNALAYWTDVAHPSIFTRAQAATTFTLNPMVLTTNLGENQINGTITYHYEYDNRPPSFIAGSVMEIINVNDAGQQDVFAAIVVPGRAIGPVLQNLATKTAARRTINLEVLMPPSSYTFSAVEPNTDGMVALYQPSFQTSLFLEADQKNWSPTTGRYNRTVTYVYQ